MILVGPSGCGKSTTLNMIAGLEDITEGELRVGGKVINNKAPKDRDIAMVFQNYALYPHMTVRENMAFPLTLAKMDKGDIDEKVDEAAEVLELTEHLDRKPANLSGGQRQRVAMGRAIVRDPAFLMDEPLSNLDAKLRVQMRTQVSRLQKRLGTTTVYVTHDQTEAMTLGDRVVVMRGGLVQQAGTAEELYETPANLFVAGFIGSPAMNFMPATIEENALRTRLTDLPLTDQLRRTLGSEGIGRDVIIGIRPESFEDASLVAAENRPKGVNFRRDDRRRRVDGLGRLRLLHRRGQTACERRARRAGSDSGQADTGESAQSWRGSTLPRASARAKMPSCGSTPARFTSSTRRTAPTCRCGAAPTTHRWPIRSPDPSRPLGRNRAYVQAPLAQRHLDAVDLAQRDGLAARLRGRGHVHALACGAQGIEVGSSRSARTRTILPAMPGWFSSVASWEYRRRRSAPRRWIGCCRVLWR